MKRMILLIAVVAAGSFCLGAAAEKKKLKFPWAGEKLNKPCGKTELEWKCARAEMKPVAPTKLTKHFNLVAFGAKPQPNGLLVKALVVHRPKVVIRQLSWNAAVEYASRMVLAKVRKEIGGDVSQNGLMDEAEDCQIEVYEGATLIGIRTQQGFVLQKR